jgi:histidinol-phosphate aminotransferase
MTTKYQKPAELYDGLRLHQNENTGGPSPKVFEAMAALTPTDLAFYPPYAATIDACARYLGVPSDRVALTNGLDEGIMFLSVAHLRERADGFIPEVIVPEPAFEIFRVDAEVVGGRFVGVAPRPDFSFPLEEVLAAITAQTRVIMVTNPNNPTGVAVPLDVIRRLARRAPRGVIVFVDEAYAEFSGRTMLEELEAFPNMIVGRTFSKAFGLAGLRIGCLVGAPEVLDPIRLAIPVYSVNAAATAAVRAALEDRATLNDYLRQVEESKALLYEACDALGLRYWRSAANFVLVRIGDRVGDFTRAAEARGIYVRDRSTEPGCEGCLRVATGLVEHTKRFIQTMGELL